jgi:DNA-binding transcriptional MerR regulator/methylmalonyl-CoA mutase cobalamin-binding subunit
MRKEPIAVAGHPIGVVSARTGLPPGVIRVWERRYGAVHPLRDAGGNRLYSDEEVEKLRLLARATGAGRRIGQVAGLTVSDLRALVEEDDALRWHDTVPSAPGGEEDDAGSAVPMALELVRQMDGDALERHLRRQAVLLGLPSFLEHVVAPLFRAIGEEWHEGRLHIAQEHLASEVAQALLTRLVGPVAGNDGRPVMVVATLSGERHEIGALMVAALGQAEGWRVVYLGPDLPADEVVDAARRTGAQLVALSLVYEEGEGLAARVARVRSGLPTDVDVVIGGPAATGLHPLTGVRELGSCSELRRYLSGGAAQRG